MKKLLIIIGFTFVVGSFGLVYWYFNKNIEPASEPILTDQSATSTKSSFDKTPVGQDRNYKGQPMSFLGKTEILSRYPKEFVDNYQQRLATAINMIQKYPEDEVYWIELGIVKKTFDNYLGARDAWEYALLINNRNAVVYYNLGNLYALYLRDFQKAEAYYKTSVVLDPFSAQSYLALAEFYKNFLKEKYDFVDDILLKGIENLPNDGNLILNLALYYKSVGKKEAAIEYFERFLELPDLTGTQTEAIQKEINFLR